MSRDIMSLFLFALFSSFSWSTELRDSEMQNLGKEKIIRGKDTIEVEVIMYSKGETVVFEKRGKNFELDSTVYSNGVYFVDETYEIDEAHTLTRSTRSTTPREILFFIYDNNGKMVQGYSIGMEKTQIYDDKGVLHPIYKEVRGDTVFWDVENFNQWDGSSLFIN